MSDENNFKPTLEGYKPLRPFNLFMKNNFPFIENTFEALDTYGLLCEIVKYLNTAIENVNTTEENITLLSNAFNELNDYVSHYFDNLDVQEEINNKLDTLVENGTLGNIINNSVFEDLSNQIVQNAENIGTLNQQMNTTIKQTDVGTVGMAQLSQEVKSALTGGSTPVVGINSVGTQNILNDAVTIYKLDNLLEDNFTKQFSNVSLGTINSGHYAIVSDGQLAINSQANTGYYTVSLESGAIYQFLGMNWFAASGIIVVDSTDSNRIMYASVISDSAKQFTNANIIFRANKAGLVAYINKYTDTTVVAEEVREYITLMKLTEITEHKKENSLSLIKTIEGVAQSYQSSTTTANAIRFGANQYASIKMYKLSRGNSYYANGYNIYDYCGLIITNEYRRA